MSFAWLSDINRDVHDFKRLTVSARHDIVNDNNLQLSEENETKTDDDFELQALVLPFLVAGIHKEFFHQTQYCRLAPAEKANSDIYLRACNFRI